MNIPSKTQRSRPFRKLNVFLSGLLFSTLLSAATPTPTQSTSEVDPTHVETLSASMTGITNFDKPFNEYTWVTAHNAYLNDMKAQLERGVRGFMLDIHLAKKPYPDQTDFVYLCHTNGEKCDKAAQGGNDPLFSAKMNEVFIPFLKQHPKEVITIFLESRVPYNNLKEAFKNIPGIEDWAFNISDFDNSNGWPTLQQLIDSGRRIIIFGDTDEISKGYNPSGVSGTKFNVLLDNRFANQNMYGLGSVLLHNWSCVTRYGPTKEHEKWIPPQEFVPEQPAIPERPCTAPGTPIGCPLPAEEAKPEIPARPGYYQTIPADPGIPLIDASISGRPSWKRLFLMNQFHKIDKAEFDAGNKDNNLTYLDRRVEQYCAQTAGARYVPNYIAIDYNQVGDAFPYAKALTQGGFYFYEGSNADPARDAVCVLPTGQDQTLKLPTQGCENDEIQSLALRGIAKGTRLTVYDNGDGNQQDDYSIIDVTLDIPLNAKLVIGSFEQTSNSNLWYSIRHIHNNGLNGKISRIKIEQHPSDFTDAAIALHEGRNGSENIVCTVGLTSATAFNFGGDCDNDEAKSATLLSAKAGTKITLYGQYDSNSCKQGCLTIETKRSITWPIQVGNLESSYENADVKVTRSGGTQQLEGKVSSIRVEFLPDTTPPGKPLNPVISTITGTSATLNWTAASDNIGVVGYRVSLNGASPVTVTSTQHIFRGLADGVQYTAEIRALDAAANISAPSTITFTTLDATPPTPPTELEVTPTAVNGMATARWQPSHDTFGIARYEVWNNDKLIAYQPSNLWIFTFLTLDRTIPNVIKVRATDKSGLFSEFAQYILEPTAIEPPSDLHVQDISSTSAKVKWTKISEASGYKLQINSNTPVDVSDPAYGYQITGLTPDTTQTIKVSAVYASGTSEPASIDFKTADAHLQKLPKNLRVITNKAPVLTLGWDAPSEAENLTGYKISQGIFSVGYGLNIYRHTILAQKGNEYTFKLSAVYSDIGETEKDRVAITVTAE
ncbi:fibronectin type III domain-containing protein [Pseudomonas sp. GM48]|uniref:fibronectin type III domain-containing protein n=1 Tax=Pseudomonas sp. GM48 TaxID=1144330 RepID=UPI00027028DE|nr:fibronectin type III domain-containing protein [Pseudomonas sp. GM48]EJM55367.1 fibronectin type III domain-containing protein [Pseudomonas sp. GM48]